MAQVETESIKLFTLKH